VILRESFDKKDKNENNPHLKNLRINVAFEAIRCENLNDSSLQYCFYVLLDKKHSVNMEKD